MRRRVCDISAPRRRRVADVAGPPRRLVSTVVASPTPARRRVVDVQADVTATPRRRRFVADIAQPEFVPPAEFYGSPYQTWAAGYFTRNLWRVPPNEDVDDLLQMAWFKYKRNIELYIYGGRTCRGPAHFMCLFKTACHNLVHDRARKKMRSLCTESLFSIDSEVDFDHTLMTVEALL